MSWLDSIKESSAARLVSSAARELFTEGTSEISDDVAHLNNAYSKISHLESLVNEYKSELSHSREENRDLSLKVETLELQTLHFREETDASLQEREEQIRELMSRLESRREEPEGECLMPRGSNQHQPALTQSYVMSDSIIEIPNKNIVPSSVKEIAATIQALHEELAKTREEKCREISDLQDANDFRVARLVDRVHELEELTTSQPGKPVVSVDASTHTEPEHGNNGDDLSETATKTIKEGSVHSWIDGPDPPETGSIDPPRAALRVSSTFDDAEAAVSSAIDDLERTVSDFLVHPGDGVVPPAHILTTTKKTASERLTDLNNWLLRRHEEFDLLFKIKQVDSFNSAAQTENQTNTEDDDVWGATDAHEGGGGGGAEDDDYEEDDPLETRFARLSDALASAVTLLPPPPSPSDPGAPDFSTPWPPSQPEAQVAVLVAAEAASRRELMFVRDAFFAMQNRNSPSAEECPASVEASQETPTVVSALLKSVLEDARLLLDVPGKFGDTRKAFLKSAKDLTDTSAEYEPLVEVLTKSLFDNAILCEVLCDASIEDILIRIGDLDKATLSPSLRLATEYLSRILRAGLLAYLQEVLSLAEKGEPLVSDVPSNFSPNDAAFARRFTDLLKTRTGLPIDRVEFPDNENSQDPVEQQLSEDKYNALRTSIRQLVGSCTASVRDLSPEDQDLVENLKRLIREPKDAGGQEDGVADLRAYLCDLLESGAGDLDSLPPANREIARFTGELISSRLSQHDRLRASLKNLIDSSAVGNLEGLSSADCEIVERLGELISQQLLESTNLRAHDALRTYLRDLVASGVGNLELVNPTDREVAQQLSELLLHHHNHTDDADAVNGGYETILRLARSITKALREDSGLENVSEGIRAATVTRDADAAVLECLARLVSDLSAVAARHAQSERDKVALSQLVRAKHAESQAYHGQLQKLLLEQQQQQQQQQTSIARGDDDLQKLMAKVQQLQTHLIQTEESHTKEALESEEREASLRDRLTQTERQLEALQEFVGSADEEISAVRQERDSARSACRTSQSELDNLKTNYSKLQKAMETLERNKHSDASLESRHFQLENARLQTQVSTLAKHVDDLTADCVRLEELKQSNGALHGQLERQESRLLEAHAQARRFEEQIQVHKSQLRQISNELDGKLDKAVMKNLLISCMKVPAVKRPEAFRSLGSVLNFTTEDYHLLGFDEPVARNWRDLFWTSRSDQDNTEASSEPQMSFVEMLASFLEKESAPVSQIRLPTDHLGGPSSPESRTVADTGSRTNSPEGFNQRKADNNDPASLQASQFFAAHNPRVIYPSPQNPLLSGLNPHRSSKKSVI